MGVGSPSMGRARRVKTNGKTEDMKSGKKQSRGSSKSNTAVLFNRYVRLVDTIYRAGRISSEEINEQWERSSLNDMDEELPLKTFHNHKNALFYKFRKFRFYL